MTYRAKQTLLNYIKDIGGIKTFPKGKRFIYLKALIIMLNDLEEYGLYEKMKIQYDFKISIKPMIFVK
jgi:hypothetical protein